jgi:hypothetical protein
MEAKERLAHWNWNSDSASIRFNQRSRTIRQAAQRPHKIPLISCCSKRHCLSPKRNSSNSRVAASERRFSCFRRPKSSQKPTLQNSFVREYAARDAPVVVRMSLRHQASVCRLPKCCQACAPEENPPTPCPSTTCVRKNRCMIISPTFYNRNRA